jgi:peptidoglycan hydrolase CwlO-like protein
MARKSDMNDQEVRFLREQIEKERRKSTADDNLVRKLEHLLAEKIKIIDESKQKETSLETDLRDLANALDGERKKSLADEATIRKLETEYKKKTEEANRKQEQFYKAAEAIKLTENEIGFLRGELDNERRKSSVDQNRLKKFEEMLN